VDFGNNAETVVTEWLEVSRLIKEGPLPRRGEKVLMGFGVRGADFTLRLLRQVYEPQKFTGRMGYLQNSI